MSRGPSTGPLGTAVVVAFLMGLLSAPLRPCSSHPGHDHGDPGHGSGSPLATSGSHEHHRGHASRDVSDADEENGATGGCECLGLCSLEHGPFLALGDVLASALAPASDEASLLDARTPPVAGDPGAVPLARGPPLPV